MTSASRNARRREVIASHYQHKHPWLWDSTTSLLADPGQWQDRSVATSWPAKAAPCSAAQSPVFVIREVFSQRCLSALASEVRNFESASASSSIPRVPPHVHAASGAILHDLGLDGLISRFIQGFLSPLAQSLFPDVLRGGLSSADFFAAVLTYECGGNSEHARHDMELHTDESSLTMSLCLGDSDFQGGDLLFSPAADAQTSFQSVGRRKHSRARTTRTMKFKKLHLVHGKKRSRLRRKRRRKRIKTKRNVQSRATFSRVIQTAGQAVVFLGRSSPHTTSPLVQGRRANLVIWCASQRLVNKHPHGIYQDYLAYLSLLVPEHVTQPALSADTRGQVTQTSGDVNRKGVSFSIPTHFMTSATGTTRRPSSRLLRPPV